ncbi:MAG: hypothetical protein ACT4NT_03005 [Nitrososphaerota archaeon]
MSDNPYKAMVAISVEVVLMRNGGPQYQLVLARLERDHECKIFDCFEHPEYLKSTLQDVYGKDYQSIVEKIELELGESSAEKEITDFLNILKQ